MVVAHFNDFIVIFNHTCSAIILKCVTIYITHSRERKKERVGGNVEHTKLVERME